MTARTCIVIGLIAATTVVESCSSKDPLLRTRDAAADAPAATGGSGTASGGAPPAGTGGLGGTPVTTGSGGVAGSKALGSGGVAGSGAPGTGGHDIAPVVCGSTMCQLGLQCCQGCGGSMTCGAACTSPVCPTDAGADANVDAGADADGGATALCGGQICSADTSCCGPPSCGFCRNPLMGVACQALCPPLDGGADLPAGSIACGPGSCGPLEACVHPSRGGTCTMPDAGVCPTGTSLEGGCCLPPDNPRCVPIDRACNGPTVTCACFSKDPCNGGGCASSLITGHDIACVGA